MKHLFQGELQTLETWPTRARSTNMMKLCQSHYAKPSALSQDRHVVQKRKEGKPQNTNTGR